MTRIFKRNTSLLLSLCRTLSLLGYLVVEPKQISRTSRLPQEMSITAQELSMKLTLCYVFVSVVYANEKQKYFPAETALFQG